MFGKRKEEVVPTQNGVNVVNRWNTPMQLVWRTKYDQDRAQAVVEGRSCGKCIEGVVYFGPGFEDQAPCRIEGTDCKFAKAGSAE